MTSAKKTGWTFLSGALTLACFAGNAMAADADSGQFIIRILPQIDVGVTVNTTGAAWVDGGDLDLNNAAMDTQYVMYTGVTITMAGDFNNQELTLEATTSDSWTLDTDETATANQLRLYAMAGEYQTTAPAQASFDGTQNLLTGSAVRVGQTQPNESGDTGHVYELAYADTGYEDMDGMVVGTQRTLWLRAGTPASTVSDEAQAWTITVTAVTGTGL